MTRRSLPLCIALSVGLAGGVLPVAADERILAFNSEVQVSRDGSVQVAEAIRVRAEGDQIKRGIYRDFPTRYPDGRGGTIEVGFTVLAAERDGAPEPFFTRSESNGIRVYLGNKDVFLPTGVHTYRLTYRTDRQLGFFPDHDELYWNATGNGWSFPIDAATCLIRLPDGIPVDRVRVLAFTGVQGSREQAIKAETRDHEVVVEATRPLGPGEGLTVVATWPTGFVATPVPGAAAKVPSSSTVGTSDPRSLFTNFHPFSQPMDTPALRTGAVGMAVLLLYYLLAWFKVGRDPRKGVIVPLFEPPEKLTPAAVRYLTRMRFDQECLSSTVLDLAVKGVLTIERTGGQFVLHRTGKEVPLPSEERAVTERLFSSGDSLVLESSHHQTLTEARKELESALKGFYFKRYFLHNTLFLVPGIVIAIITLLLAAAWPLFTPPAAGESTARMLITAPGVFMLFWLSGWTTGTFFLFKQVMGAWREFSRAHTVTTFLAALWFSVFSLPFLGGELMGLGFLLLLTSVWLVLLFVAMLSLTLLFHHLLKAPTVLGRGVLDKIEGFKQYLSLAEADRLARLHPAARTPALFERFLPYALALGVENQWACQFDDVLEAAGKAGPEGYHPVWYSGGGFSGRAFGTGFASALSGSIASASTAPGSSSGSGGGGSSGGGGGGGGGGGW